MMLDTRSSAALTIQEVNAPDMGKLADVFLRKKWKENPTDDQPSFEIAIGKLLDHLNIEYELDAEITKNHHLLWFKNEEVIGFTKVTHIQPGKEARVRFILFDESDLHLEEIVDRLISSVEKTFSKFNLERLLISVDTTLEENPLEKRLLEHYRSFPVGFVHLSTKIREYAIVSNGSKHKEYFTYWL